MLTAKNRHHLNIGRRRAKVTTADIQVGLREF